MTFKRVVAFEGVSDTKTLPTLRIFIVRRHAYAHWKAEIKLLGFTKKSGQNICFHHGEMDLKKVVRVITSKSMFGENEKDMLGIERFLF